MKKSVKILIATCITAILLLLAGLVAFSFDKGGILSRPRNFGVICGLIIGLLFTYIIFLMTKKDNKSKCEYDERQQVIRGKGFKYGFFTFLFWNALYMILQIMEMPLFAEPAVMSFIGIAAAVCVYACYCIWNEAYYALNENKKSILITFCLIGTLNIGIGIMNFITHVAIQDHQLNFRSVNFICGLMIIVIFIVTLLKDIKDRKEE